MLAHFFLKKFIQRICRACASSKVARKIGTYLHTPQGGKRLWNAFLKLFMESYFDFCFGVILNLIAFAEASKIGNLNEHFGSFTNVLNSSLTIFYGLALVLFPLNAYLMMKFNSKFLHLKQFKDKYGLYYEGMKLTEAKFYNYNIFFMIRRLVTVLVLIFVRETPFF
jgi:hypothetical protein